MIFSYDYDKLVRAEKRRIEWNESVEVTAKKSLYYKIKGTVIAIIPPSNGFPVLYELLFPDGKTDTFNRNQIKKLSKQTGVIGG